MRPQPYEGTVLEVLDARKQRPSILDNEVIAPADDVAYDELRLREVRRTGDIGNNSARQRGIGSGIEQGPLERPERG